MFVNRYFLQTYGITQIWWKRSRCWIELYMNHASVIILHSTGTKAYDTIIVSGHHSEFIPIQESKLRKRSILDIIGQLIHLS